MGAQLKALLAGGRVLRVFALGHLCLSEIRGNDRLARRLRRRLARPGTRRPDDGADGGGGAGGARRRPGQLRPAQRHGLRDGDARPGGRRRRRHGVDGEKRPPGGGNRFAGPSSTRAAAAASTAPAWTAATARMPGAEYFRRANAETVVAVQIEHVDAVEDVERIAAVPDLDFLFIGPADLSQSMGIPGEWEHPRMWAAVERTARAAAANRRGLGDPAARRRPRPPLRRAGLPHAVDRHGRLGVPEGDRRDSRRFRGVFWRAAGVSRLMRSISRLTPAARRRWDGGASCRCAALCPWFAPGSRRRRGEAAAPGRAGRRRRSGSGLRSASWTRRGR